MMRNEIKNCLAAMKVREDKESAEEYALKIYSHGPEAFELLVGLGWDLMKNKMETKPPDTIRAVIFAMAVFYRKARAKSQRLPNHEDAVNLLMELTFAGFRSAAVLLSDLGYDEADIYRKKLLSLPQVAAHSHDKEISLNEAIEEIRLSKSYTGVKGFRADRYALGNDSKRVYDIFRIDKKRFALRTKKTG